jgi:hypothetical protein
LGGVAVHGRTVTLAALACLTAASPVSATTFRPSPEVNSGRAKVPPGSGHSCRGQGDAPGITCTVTQTWQGAFHVVRTALG